jgi:hypothetical protein
LKASEEVYGAQSPMLGEPLQNLGMMAAYQHDLFPRTTTSPTPLRRMKRLMAKTAPAWPPAFA